MGFGAGKTATPAAPLPPSPPAAPLPSGAAAAATSDASRVIRPSGVADTQPDQVQAASEKTSLWNSLQAFAWPVKAPAPQPAPAPVAPRVATAKPRTAVRAPAAAVEQVGRFDPDFGTAAYVVSDGQAPVEAAPLRPQAWANQNQQDQEELQSGPMVAGRSSVKPIDEPEHSASVSDEPVSLVSWLAGQYSGQGNSGRQGGGFCPDVCLKDRCCPTWEAQVDALFLWQGNIPSQPLYFNTETQQTVLDVNQLQNKAAIAPRYAIIYNHDDCRAIEVNYFQVWGFNSAASVGPTFNAAGNGAYTVNILNQVAFENIAYAQATGTAHIQSLEVNLRRRDGASGMIQWISGFRWLEWGQGLSVSDYAYVAGDPTADPPIDPIINPEQISVTTLNNLYGWQWGGDMMLWNAGRWLRINGIGKAGVYYNHQASQNTYYNDFQQPATVAAASNDTVSFVGETGVNCSWALTNWLSWRGGYSFFWLSGMAVPANQLKLTDLATGTTSVNTNGSVFIHGLTTGLEARW